MININYQKRKNQKLFKSLENKDYFFLSKTQNYIPIYNRFFNLNEKNYNHINLNHPWYLSDLKRKKEENIYECFLEKTGEEENDTNHGNKNNKEVREVFFKLAPLLDPFKYLIGKYDLKDERLFSLPNLQSTEENTMKKIMNVNNAAYIDSFFLYLNSILIHNYNFIHGVDFYGTFLSIKNNYQLNVVDDLEYLVQSDFFIKNKNILFQIDEYEHLLEDESEEDNRSQIKKSKIKIEDTDFGSNLEILVDEMLVDEMLVDEMLEMELLEDKSSSEFFDENIIEYDTDFYNDLNITTNDKITTLKSHSSCSSRTSHTDSETENEFCSFDEKEIQEENDDHSEDINQEEDDYETIIEDEEGDEEEDEDLVEEKINVVFPHFPVQVICMENCSSTLDDLIIQDELTEEQWFSAFMQIIMILITLQKTFSFTHNDLHTNNVMYIETEKKFLYYCYEGIYYKVPTFGRIFKIIDFGRSIYHYDGKVFCSDSFEEGGDASTQYNTEPYFNNKKARIEPNYSFDLCRLACSIFDYVVDDFQEIKNLENCSKVARLIIEWCLDDKGINVLYKNNGEERYPEFKLYKMIARCVHHHTPQLQLERDIFKNFMVSKNQVSSKTVIMNIDLFTHF